MSKLLSNNPIRGASGAAGAPLLGYTQNVILCDSSQIEQKHTLNSSSISSINLSDLKHTEKGHELAIIRDKRDTRYALRWQIRNEFLKIGTQMGIQHPHDFHRTAKCGHILIAPLVGLNLGIEHHKAFYTGLSTCSNVWTCPVCSAKIQERRRIEISQAMTYSYANGKKCVMLTFTFPHTAFDDVQDLLTKQAAAQKLLRTGVMWQRYKEKIGYVGLIRAQEITVGVNGFHPHTHELWIVDKDADIVDLYKTVYKRWENACIKTGLLHEDKIAAFKNRAVNIKDNAQNSDYLAKFDNCSWGVDREIAKASSKTSGGNHPFDLLCECCGNIPLSKEKRLEMFIHYSVTMKGKKQLHWSTGLKKLVGINEKTDEEICQEPDEIAIVLGLITPDRWKFVVDEVAQAEIQYLAEMGGWKLVDEWFTQRERKKNEFT